MIQREITRPPKYVYPPDEWRLVERRLYPRLLPQTESFFALSNGYFGMRGGFEEGHPSHEHGTFVNGFYESWPIVYGEEAHGFATTGQTIVNLPDPKIIRLYVDDERLYLPRANLDRFERVLDMRKGTLDREVLWVTPAGKRVCVRSRRLVSFVHRYVAAIEYEVTVLDEGAVISSELVQHDHAEEGNGDPRRRALGRRVLMPRVGEAEDLRVILGFATRNSGMTLGCGIDHVIETSCPVDTEVRQDGKSGRVVFSVDASPEAPIRITKFISFHTSSRVPAEELCERAGRTLSRVRSQGFAELAAASSSRARPLPRSRARPSTRSRRSASTSSASCRRRRAPTGEAFPPRGSPARATKGTTSGTRRSTCFPSSSTRCRTPRAICSRCVIAGSTWRVSGPAR